jgi:hypothetical protein
MALTHGETRIFGVPYASDAVFYVTLRIRPSSRPVEKYPPIWSADRRWCNGLTCVPNWVICAQLGVVRAARSATVSIWVLPGPDAESGMMVAHPDRIETRDDRAHRERDGPCW